MPIGIVGPPPSLERCQGRAAYTTYNTSNPWLDRLYGVAVIGQSSGRWLIYSVPGARLAHDNRGESESVGDRLRSVIRSRAAGRSGAPLRAPALALRVPRGSSSPLTYARDPRLERDVIPHLERSSLTMPRSTTNRDRANAKIKTKQKFITRETNDRSISVLERAVVRLSINFHTRAMNV